MLGFTKAIQWIYESYSEILPGLLIVQLEKWMPLQPDCRYLQTQYQKSLPTYHLPRVTRLKNGHTILAVINPNTRRLISLLHCCLVPWNPAVSSKVNNLPNCLYLVYSETPNPLDRGKGLNTILRIIAIRGCQNDSLPFIVSLPYPGAKSSGVLDRLQFKTQGEIRYLPITNLDKTYVRSYLTSLLSPTGLNPITV